MPQVSRPGLLHISVDVGYPLDRLLDAQRAAESSALAVLEHLACAGLAATWALSEPESSGLADCVTAANHRHEIALLGEKSWIGPGLGRQPFARELSRRVLAAQAAGHALTTLALRDCELPAHTDLLIKHGLSAVRAAAHGTADKHDWRIGLSFPGRLLRFGRPVPTSLARTLRWGLWEFTAALDVSGQGYRRATSAIKRSARNGTSVHLLIDVSTLAAHHGRAVDLVNRVLRYAAKLQIQGLLDNQTLATAVAGFTQPRHEDPARSILRPKAA